MAVHRLGKYQTQDPFTRIPNVAVNDKRLDLKARGLLLLMLSKPDGWRFTETNLARDAGVGRDQLRTAIGMLIDAGYVYRWHDHGDGRPVMRTSVSDRSITGDGWKALVGPSSGQPKVENPEGRETQHGSNEPDAVTNETAVTKDDEPSSTRVDFDQAWELYPRRNGKRVGKAAAKAKWAKLGSSDQQACLDAIGNYARACDSGQTIAKDMERFLKADYWRDWIDPPDPSSNGVRSSRRATVSTPAGGWKDGEF